MLTVWCSVPFSYRPTLCLSCTRSSTVHCTRHTAERLSKPFPSVVNTHAKTHTHKLSLCLCITGILFSLSPLCPCLPDCRTRKECKELPLHPGKPGKESLLYHCRSSEIPLICLFFSPPFNLLPLNLAFNRIPDLQHFTARLIDMHVPNNLA